MHKVEAYMLFSGSSGNAAYIKSGSDEFLIDAGVSCRAIENSLQNLGTSLSNIRAIFITHEHNDHVRGLETISKRFNIPIFVNRHSASLLKAKSSFIEDKIKIAMPGDTVFLSETVIKTGTVMHDSVACACYNIELADGKKLGYATDIGVITNEVEDILLGCDYVVIESNHDINTLKKGPYPSYLKRRILSDTGHLSNNTCAAFLPSLVQQGARNIVLAHLSRENNRPDLAFAESRISLNQAGIRVKLDDVVGDVTLCVAEPNTPVKIIL